MRLHPFSMKVLAPIWSACTTGRWPVNIGAGAVAVSAACCLYLSTRRRISSLSAARSVSAPSTFLKSAMISRLTISRSANACAASSLPLISVYCLRSSAEKFSMLIAGSRGADHLERQPFFGGQQPSGIQDHHGPPVVPREQSADVLGCEPLHQRRRRGDGPAVDPHHVKDL